MMRLSFWILSGIICGLVANWKKRNPFYWFLCGFIFGPFAILALAFFPKIEKLKRCPFCSQLVKGRVCRSCGMGIQDTIDLGKDEYKVE
ncbi:MAG: hypothetical protein QME40_07940 [bacterium]|nr:hypothetical protein [bacterium]